MNTNWGAQKPHYQSDTAEDRYVYQRLGDLQQHKLEQSISILFLWVEPVFKGQKWLFLELDEHYLQWPGRVMLGEPTVML